MVLIFQREVNGKTELCGVEIDNIPVNTKNGWRLIGTGDSFVMMQNQSKTTASSQDDVVQEATTTEKQAPVIPIGAAYESTVEGTARLIRRKDRIFIAWRKGNATRNVNSPDSVCISNFTKQQFFNDVRSHHFGDDWALTSIERSYDYWNKWIDDEYEHGRQATNNKLAREFASSHN